MTQLEETLEKLSGKKIYSWKEEKDQKTYLFWDTKTSRYELTFSTRGKIECIAIYTRGKRLVALSTPGKFEGMVIGAYHYGYDRLRMLEDYLGFKKTGDKIKYEFMV